MFETITVCGSEQQHKLLCNVTQNKGRCKTGKNWKEKKKEMKYRLRKYAGGKKKKRKKLMLPNGTVLGRWYANVEGSLLEGVEETQG